MDSRLYSVYEVVASIQKKMDIPGPMDDMDDLSGAEFDGFLYSEDSKGNGEWCKGDRGAGLSKGACGTDAGGDDVEERDIANEHGCSGGDIPEYTCTPGYTQATGNDSPLHFLKMLVTDTMLDTIVRETNRYATQYISTHTLPPCSRVQQWSRQEFDGDKLKKVLTLALGMGLVNLPTIEDHWVTT